MTGKSPAEAALTALSQATGRGRGRHSPLYLWFREHHDELLAGFAKSGPSWQTLALFLGQQGVLDADGKLPTARGARDAWLRVRQDVRAAAGMPSPASVSATQGQLGTQAKVQPVSVLAPQPAAVPELPLLSDDRPRMPRPKFRTLK